MTDATIHYHYHFHGTTSGGDGRRRRPIRKGGKTHKEERIRKALQRAARKRQEEENVQGTTEEVKQEQQDIIPQNLPCFEEQDLTIVPQYITAQKREEEATYSFQYHSRQQREDDASQNNAVQDIHQTVDIRNWVRFRKFMDNNIREIMSNNAVVGSSQDVGYTQQDNHVYDRRGRHRHSRRAYRHRREGRKIKQEEGEMQNQFTRMRIDLPEHEFNASSEDNSRT